MDCDDCYGEEGGWDCGYPAERCKCSCHWPKEPDHDRDDETGRGQPCIGAACVNPHPMHDRSECETAEMYEAAALRASKEPTP